MGIAIRFLGTSTVVPEANQDTASFLINDRILVDTGWYAAIKMKAYGVNPMDLDYVFITHCHHDHYIGLPQILFYLRMRRDERPDRPRLKIIGPMDDIDRVVLLSCRFLQTDRFPDLESMPDVYPLCPGESYEDDEFRIETCATKHPVQGLCYRYQDRASGGIASFTGDTAYFPPIAEHVRGSGLLIHEASHGRNEVENGCSSGHASALDAARIARVAGVRKLALIHCPEDQQAVSVAAARTIFPDTIFPENGEQIELS